MVSFFRFRAVLAVFIHSLGKNGAEVSIGRTPMTFDLTFSLSI
jgi:hypothetical protein